MAVKIVPITPREEGMLSELVAEAGSERLKCLLCCALRMSLFYLFPMRTRVSASTLFGGIHLGIITFQCINQK